VSSPIIARADALMQRRRQSDLELDDIPVLTDSIDQFDDIPVLTDIEPMPLDEPPPESGSEAVDPAPEAPQNWPDESPSDDNAAREQVINELAGRIEDRIKAVLPEIISSTIREFLAEQEMIENS
jgi:hypothetical protein